MGTTPFRIVRDTTLNKGKEMEKNTILAVILSIGILLVWFRFFQPAPPPQIQQQAYESGQVQEDAGVLPPVVARGDRQSRQVKTGEPRREAEIITVHTKESVIELTARGGSIKHWYVNEEQEKKENMPDLVFLKDVDMLPLKVGARNFGDLSEEVFEVRAEFNNIILHEGESTKVQFDYLTNSGIHISKIYSFSYEGNIHGFKVKTTNESNEDAEIKNLSITWEAGLGIAGEGVTDKEKKTIDKMNKENPRFMKAMSFMEGRLRRKLKVDEISPSIEWTSITNRYFASMLINKDRDFSRVIINSYKKEGLGGKIPQVGLGAEAFTLQPGGSKAFELDLYVGLKDSGRLEKLGLNLEKVINYGFFDPISKLFMTILKFFYKVTHNYGIAIILLTLVIHLITFPLTKKSLDSTRKMKKIQPHMKEIQAKYKDDPKRLNVEMMNMYKTKGVNPFGGCLPMLLQLPVFFALFTMLRMAIELRYEGFLWVPDLSMKDPYFIFPILMGVAMFFQQKLTSPGGDPAQQKIMMFMPVFFTFIFLQFPAGLTLYWFTNNILSLTQHTIMNMKDKRKNLVIP